MDDEFFIFSHWGHPKEKCNIVTPPEILQKAIYEATKDVKVNKETADALRSKIKF